MLYISKKYNFKRAQPNYTRGITRECLSAPKKYPTLFALFFHWVVGLGFLCMLEALCILVLVYLEALCAFFFVYNTLTCQKKIPYTHMDHPQETQTNPPKDPQKLTPTRGFPCILPMYMKASNDFT
jgi:hypothetical protein